MEITTHLHQKCRTIEGNGEGVISKVPESVVS